MKNKLIVLLIAGFAVSGCSIQEFPANEKNFVETTYNDVKDVITGNVENIDYKEDGYSMKELEEEKRNLPADDAFKKSILHFCRCIEDKEVREENYNTLLRQAQFIEDFKQLSGLNI